MRSPILALFWCECRSFLIVVAIYVVPMVASMAIPQMLLSTSEESASMSLLLLAAPSLAGMNEMRTLIRGISATSSYFITLPMRLPLWIAIRFAFSAGGSALIIGLLAVLSERLFGADSLIVFPTLRFTPWTAALFGLAFGALLEGFSVLMGNLESRFAMLVALLCALGVFGWVVCITVLVETENSDQTADSPMSGEMERLSIPSHASGDRVPTIEEEYSPWASSKHAMNPRDQETESDEGEAQAEWTASYTDRVHRRAKSVTPVQLVIWAGLIAVGYLLSYIGSLRYRQGGILSRSALFSRRESLGTPTARFRVYREPNFANKRAAAIWFEWTRFGRYLPLAAVIIVSPFALLYMTPSDAGLGMFPSETEFFFIHPSAMFYPMFMFGLAWVSGVIVRSRYQSDRAVDAFLFTLPIHSKAIASAQLATYWRSLILSLLVGDAILTGLVAYAMHDVLDIEKMIVGFIVISLPVLFAMVAGFWLSVVSILFVALSYIGNEALPIIGPERGELLAAPQVVIGSMVVTVSLWTIWRANRQGLLLAKQWASMLTLALAAVCVYSFYQPSGDTQFHPAIHYHLIGALVASVPFASAPATIDRIRHKRGMSRVQEMLRKIL